MILGSGTAAFVNGSAVVPMRRIPAGAHVFLTRVAALGVLGELRHDSITMVVV